MRTRAWRVAATAGLALNLWAATATAQTTLTINAGAPGIAISTLLRGVNMANWFDITQSGIVPALTNGWITAVRWPGGSESDLFHWQSNTACDGGYVAPNSTFDAFVQKVVVPAKAALAVTVNYGTDIACTGPGDPAEAAAWVAHAKSTGAPVTYWTVGNEVFGSWETDLHSKPNDAATYANAVATGYYPLIKAQNPAAQVGVVVQPGWSPAWDPIVLANAKYDFVELHYYAQQPGSENDSYLVQSAAQGLASEVATLKTELAAAGHPNTPIYVGELGSVSSDPGKQTSSITQALYAGQALAELAQAGAARATWWIGFGGCADASDGGNFSSALYGWQAFGGYMLFSDGLPEYGCSNAPALALGVPLPTARAIKLFGYLAAPGAHMLPATLSGAPGTLRAYASLHQGKVVALLFNLDQNSAAALTATVSGQAVTQAMTWVYDKAIYDKSQTGVWAGPALAFPAVSGASATVTLPPWSITALTLW
jgi:hypothetical protein